MEGIGGEHDNNPERPEEPNSGLNSSSGSFETNEPAERTGEPEIPLVPTERSPLDEGQHIESEAEILRTFIGEMDEITSAELASRVAFADVVPGSVPPPVDHSAPFGIEHFTGPEPSQQDAGYAAGTLSSSMIKVYAKYQDEVERRFLEDDDGIVTTSYALRMGYQDERGYATIVMREVDNVSIAFRTPDGKVEGYEVSLKQREGSWSAHRVPRIAVNEARDLHGTMPVDELNDRVSSLTAQDDHFDSQLQELTGSTPHVVDRDEARYLESIIAAAEPLGARQDQGEFADHIERRLGNVHAPDIMQSTWAAHRLEQITQRHVERFGPEPVERLYDDGGRHVVVRATPASEGRPATITATTEYAVSADEVDQMLRRPALFRGEHKVVWTDTISAAATNVVVESGMQLFDPTDKDPIAADDDTYDHGDITDVDLFARLLRRPQ